MGEVHGAAPLVEVIDHIGAFGDGVIVRTGQTACHVSRTLPGETVSIRPQPPSGRHGVARLADLASILAPSPDRVAPPCPHFLQGCGGCALQHWRDEAYAGWKRGLVTAALRRAGFADASVTPLVRIPPRSRRRMDFAVRRGSGGVSFGLHRAHSSDIVCLEVCNVLTPALAALIVPLRSLLSGLGALRREGSVVANLFDGGADLLIRTDGPLESTDRAKLALFAGSHAVCRVAWGLGAGRPENAALLSNPVIRFAGHAVWPPSGVFLQPTAEGEDAIVTAVLAGLPHQSSGRALAVELYAGVGTLSFPMARHMRVLAYEGHGEAALAVRRAQSGSRVEMTQRDLARQPLSARELRGAAVVILDPPYAGAETQCRLITAACVPRVIYVSCNPGALARDASLLAKAGYSLLQATPIDQFLWSAQVECVAVFDLPRSRR